ncbi:MAG: galactose mutarotase [Spirochaeta sp.]|jgi:aldose 1-epimerase|nr:galactose mutarotase [Spirochaeta sp.]
MSPAIRQDDFGRLPDGTAVSLYTLTAGDISVGVSTYGAVVTSVRVPDRDGLRGEVTLARNTLEEYLAGTPYYGALVGRVCNRVSGGGFELDGTFFSLAANGGGVHLHGGVRGFNAFVYDAEEIDGDAAVSLRLSRVSADGEEGYPGELAVEHTITVTDDNRLLFTFAAQTDKPTVVNLTNHCYWNLSAKSKILEHELRIPTTEIVAAQGSLPTGRIVPVHNGPFDFTEWKRIGRDLAALDDTAEGGYDNSYALDHAHATPAARPGAASGDADPSGIPGAPQLSAAADVRAHDTGRRMTVRTSYPAVHFYSGNHLPGEIGRTGETLSGREALCLECQYYPDTPNHPEFPSVVLRPGEHYLEQTEHRFSTF